MKTFASVFSSVQSSSVAKNEGLRSYMLGVYNYMTVALGLSGLIAFIAGKSGLAYSINTGIVGIVFAFLPLVLSMIMSAKLMTAKIETVKSLFIMYAISMGLSMSSIFAIFPTADIARAFFITAATFGSMSIYGYTTKSDLSRFSSIITMAVLGLIIASVVNIFIHSSAMSFLISIISVVVFTGLIAYDTQQIKEMYYQVGGNKEVATRIAIFGALKLYMDFVIVFIHLLKLLNASRNRD